MREALEILRAADGPFANTSLVEALALRRAKEELEAALDPERTQRTSPMVGRKEAAEILDVGRGNLTKSWVNMPPPEGRTAAGPYWLESDIRALAASPEHAERIAKREAGR